MSEDVSLTDAVKLTAGISLTRAVKDVAGCRDWFFEEVLDGEDGASQGAASWRYLFLTCTRLAAFAVLTFALLTSSSTSTILDAQRGSLAAAPNGVALVIGNSAYQHTPRLDNPKNDAADMSAALSKLGFQVIEGFDLDKVAFDAMVRDFGTALKAAQVGLFFYAGHGMQVAGHNYLVPVDAKLTTVAALDLEMVRLELVLQTMEREAKTNLLFFDACRNNPLAYSLARAMAARSLQIGRGLAAIESGAGTLISFSTQPGNVALDGTGRNSPFTGALVRQLGRSNEDLNAILIAVRNDVMRLTDGQQVPWEHSALTRRFYFDPAVPAPDPRPAAQLKLSEGPEAWSVTKDPATLAILDAFVARDYPGEAGWIAPSAPLR